ncbi:MAG: type II secretion system protein E, type IV pilus assembly protein PilB [Parcubacteria group bacterium GW2011_GWC1_41_7]|nr:MAG: type II secretion system protein E, type IV pilus assembly protein PilB [Parcubacteria group bacterium GW2011_GWC1_41_7]
MELDQRLYAQLKKNYPAIDDWYHTAQANNVPLEEFLYREGKVPNDVLARVKEKIFLMPRASVPRGQRIPYDIIQLIPENSARLHKVIVFQKDGESVSVGAVNPDDSKLDEFLNILRSSLKIDIKVYVITIGDFFYALRFYYEFDKEIQKFIEEFKLRNPIAKVKENVFLETSSPQDASVIKLVEMITKEAVTLQASDIHLESLLDKTRIRFRIQGDLQTIALLPKEVHSQVLNRIKVLAKMKLDETRIPQDGRIRVIIEGREIDLRVGVLPTISGEKVSIRILDPLVGLKTLDEIGISSFHLETIKEKLKKSYGLILLTGPTGSGKTTTLYSFLRQVNRENINVVSLEDPVEYRVEGINQSQVMPEISYTFASGLREILRQDPDVMLVGEIRDEETAHLAIHSALTGHLVFSTLHTNTAVSSITRLLNIGVERYLLPPTLHFIVTQRLVRQLCSCKKSITAPTDIEKIIDRELSELPENVQESISFKKPYTIFQPVGCDQCNGKGFIGRVGLFEIMYMDEDIKLMIEQEKNEDEILKVIKGKGFVTLRQDGILKALSGMTLAEEVIKIT